MMNNQPVAPDHGHDDVAEPDVLLPLAADADEAAAANAGGGVGVVLVDSLQEQIAPQQNPSGVVAVDPAALGVVAAPEEAVLAEGTDSEQTQVFLVPSQNSLSAAEIQDFDVAYNEEAKIEEAKIPAELSWKSVAAGEVVLTVKALSTALQSVEFDVEACKQLIADAIGHVFTDASIVGSANRSPMKWDFFKDYSVPEPKLSAVVRAAGAIEIAEPLRADLAALDKSDSRAQQPELNVAARRWRLKCWCGQRNEFDKLVCLHLWFLQEVPWSAQGNHPVDNSGVYEAVGWSLRRYYVVLSVSHHLRGDPDSSYDPELNPPALTVGEPVLLCVSFGEHVKAVLDIIARGLVL